MTTDNSDQIGKREMGVTRIQPGFARLLGRGGCNFWPSFIGGVVGGIVCNAVASPYYRDTVVVQ